MPTRNFFFLYKKIDWPLLITVLILVIFGLAAIYTLTVNQETQELTKFNRQLIFFTIGILLVFIMAAIDYRIFQSYSFIFYLLGGLLLFLVMIFGTEIRGSTAWFSFYGQTFQPVEVAKITLIIILSKYFSDHHAEMYDLKKIIISALILLPYLGMVLLQPDFGSAIILLIIWFGLLLMNKIRRVHIFAILACFVLLAVFSWFFVLQDYQQERITTFFNPSSDPLGSGYNPLQSIIAVGSGQFFGRGLGLGPQSQLNFLPLPEKDFIFAVIAEELGFVGSSLVLIFYIYLFWRLIKILREATTNFSLFLLAGITIAIFSQVFINISTNIGLLPITGIPLPFLSYGGSSLIITLFMVGMVESVRLRQRL
ncbi:MAG: rod shape-determining protein RodA [Patescibacteria group bacterium]